MDDWARCGAHRDSQSRLSNASGAAIPLQVSLTLQEGWELTGRFFLFELFISLATQEGERLVLFSN